MNKPLTITLIGREKRQLRNGHEVWIEGELTEPLDRTLTFERQVDRMLDAFKRKVDEALWR